MTMPRESSLNSPRASCSKPDTPGVNATAWTGTWDCELPEELLLEELLLDEDEEEEEDDDGLALEEALAFAVVGSFNTTLDGSALASRVSNAGRYLRAAFRRSGMRGDDSMESERRNRQGLRSM